METFDYTCKCCGIKFRSNFKNVGEKCITCGNNDELISLKKEVEDVCEEILKKGGHIQLLNWDNKDWTGFAQDILRVIHNSELILEE